MNVVVFTKNWIGDVIFQDPAIRLLKQSRPDVHLTIVAPQRCLDALRSCPYIDRFVPFDDRNSDRGFAAKWKLVRLLKQIGTDEVYIFHRSFSRALIAFLTGAPVRVGFGTKRRGLFLTKSISEPRQPMHSTQYFLYLLQQAGFKVELDCVYQFYFSEEDAEVVDRLLETHHAVPKPIVALNPGANWLPKRWPVSHFAALARKLDELFDVQIIVTGALSDEMLGEAIMAGAPKAKVISFCGKTTLTQLGALFARCQLVISNDSGPLHIAAGSGGNVIALFGPTDPFQTGPRGGGKNLVIQYIPDGMNIPWRGNKFPFGSWMELIEVEEIINVIQHNKLLGSNHDTKESSQKNIGHNA